MPGYQSCLIAMGSDADEAIRVAQEVVADIETALRLEKKRLCGAALERYVELPGRNAFWQKVRSVGLCNELGLASKEAAHAAV